METKLTDWQDAGYSLRAISMDYCTQIEPSAYENEQQSITFALFTVMSMDYGIESEPSVKTTYPTFAFA
jgi:hypothetical protein